MARLPRLAAGGRRRSRSYGRLVRRMLGPFSSGSHRASRSRLVSVPGLRRRRTRANRRRGPRGVASPRRGGTSSTVARRFAGGGFWGSSRRVAVTTARPPQPRAYVPPQTLDELPRAHGPVGVGSSPRAEGGEVDHGGVRRDCRGRRRRPPAQIYEDRSVSPVRRVPVHCCLVRRKFLRAHSSPL